MLQGKTPLSCLGLQMMRKGLTLHIASSPEVSFHFPSL
jgi:hypothetical protein